MKCNYQRGVALVITLIMLALITVVAVIFLGIARRQRASVSTQHEQIVAEYATEAAFQRAKAEIVAQIKARTNLLGFDIGVSRGYDLWNTNLVNANYKTPPRDPRGDFNGPVVVNTNYAGVKGPLDPRPHLDLNRNAEFEPTYEVTRSFTNAGGVFSNLFTVAGDPEWILLLDRPERPYGPDNRYVARMAYITLPAGLELDLNTIHNANSRNVALGSTGFQRNQGVGAWEINLAALLHEIDTNRWQYSYGPNGSPLSRGSAFTNALDFVYYRTNVFGQRQASLADLFGGTKSSLLASNLVDDIGDDDPVDGASFKDERATGAIPDSVTKPFPGAEPLQHYFTHQDLFNSNKTSRSFVENLKGILSNAPAATFRTNGYKFYDLLAQLGTDTGAENRGRINLNWANLGGQKISSLTPWDTSTNKDLALLFVTNSAQRILDGLQPSFRNWAVQVGTNWFTNSVTNINHILVSPANFYAGAVHRIMQQAANIFDASRESAFPTVFLPIFGRLSTDPSTNLYIVGWTNDNSYSGLMRWLATNTNGIPAVVGAKKGLPNFNELTVRTDMLVERKLQLSRPAYDQRPNKTNQMYVTGVSNAVAVEAWNSYATPFQLPSFIEVTNTITVLLTNTGGIQAQRSYTNGAFLNLPSWNGHTRDTPYGFRIPLLTNNIVLSNSVYSFLNNRFEQVGTNLYEDLSGTAQPYPVPTWYLSVSNHLVYIHRSGTNILDFVVIQDDFAVDLSSNLATRAISPPTTLGSVWSTNRNFGNNGPTEGLRAQIQFSQTDARTAEWVPFTQYTGNQSDLTLAIRGFRDFLNGSTNSTNLVVQTPFNPLARLIRTATWQANDPLVHYHRDDLTAFRPSVTMDPVKWNESNIVAIGSSSITNVNKAYAPWGTEGTKNSTDPNSFDFRTRDPGVTSSDNWNFPNHQYPNVGWLGRVHRGTPWQTVYFKAGVGGSYDRPLTPGDWLRHANHSAIRMDGAILSLSHPTNDARLLDIFTTALTDNSAVGLLSINQTRLPAWSAVLSGVVVLTNNASDDDMMNPVFLATTPLTNRLDAAFIEPTHGNTNSAVYLLWSAIQAERLRLGGTFTQFSQLLAVPELTTQSPFLNLNDNQRQFGLNDEAYERLPQQVLGLLRIGQPRVVIYAYGQALKPDRINTANRTVQNYQITSEFATRTVLRIEGTAQRPRTVVESFNILPPD